MALTFTVEELRREVDLVRTSLMPAPVKIRALQSLERQLLELQGQAAEARAQVEAAPKAASGTIISRS